MRLLILLASLLATPALAATPEAWDEFRADVAAKCGALAPEGAAATVEVNPFGSERFGAAIVTVQADGGVVERMVCIYDKQSRTAELTAPFAPG